MRVRPLLIGTAILSAAIGGIVVYLILTVPNDLEAAHLLKEARTEIKAGNNDKARDALGRIVQHYPRTDAAAAATIALIQLENEERRNLEQVVGQIISERQRQGMTLSELASAVTKLQSTPAPPPPPPATIAEKPQATKHHATPRKRRH